MQVDDRSGFLRGVNLDARSVGVVTLDGDTEWLTAESLTIPHPVQLGADLADYREFAVELGVSQQLPQLLREIYQQHDRNPEATAVRDFAGGSFEQLRFATGRAVSLGYRVQGGYAVTTVWQAGVEVQARYWIGADAPDYETYTEDLVWVQAGNTLPLREVGPVAFSEGMRMAAQIYAGRKSDDGEDD